MQNKARRQDSYTNVELSKIADAEKDALLREVHHRVKNNLQVITSLLSLQSATIENKNALVLFEEARNRVQAIAAIHDLLYRSASFASISLRTYAQQLLPGLLQFYGMQGRVITEVAGDDASIELERAVPFGLLLNELISNALKHAFPEGKCGELQISINLAGADIILRVSDTGVGLSPGFNLQHSNTLGLKLVNILIRQLRGSIRLVPGPRTTFEARFLAEGHSDKLLSESFF